MNIIAAETAAPSVADLTGPMRHPALRDAANGMWLSDTEPMSVDPKKLRDGRLSRLRSWMTEAGYGAVLLLDPYNQRYATGTRNMFGYFLRNSTRYFFVPASGPVVLFDYPQSYHVSAAVETVSEVRPSKLVWSSVSGRDAETVGPFAAEIADLMRQHGGGSKKIGMDRCSHIQAVALEKQGLDVVDCQGEILAVRAIKTPEEIQCLQISMTGAEAAVATVRAALKPGVTENELFAAMYHEVLRQGGEFIETRLLTSGQRTNPWFSEASGRRIRPGELVALDTDTIGCFGYFSDFSRTFHCGPGRPTSEQKTLYKMSFDQIRTVDDVTGSHSARLPTEPGRSWSASSHSVTHRYMASDAWRNAIHRPRDRFRDLRPGGRAEARHGGQRRKLYRRAERARGRQARRRGASNGARRRVDLLISSSKTIY
ncbi:MAG: Xaa-Pro peptidase family protein [Dongiaceae bacterium]